MVIFWIPAFAGMTFHLDKVFLNYNYYMFLQKDEKSKFDFISIKEFLLALLLMLITTIISFIAVPAFLKKNLFAYKNFFDSHYFGIVIFLLSSAFTLYIIYYFCCQRKNKSLKEGLFLKMVSNKILLACLLIGIFMPMLSLPIILKFAPSKFYAMDMVKTKDGLIYLFTCALFAPVFEEIFYRGFIFPFFQSKLNSFWAIIITALFFGLSHFINIGNAYILLSLFIFYGFVLTLLRYFSNSLISPIITHFIHNLTLMTSFFIMSKPNLG